jgi:hypothetical protein
MGDLERFGGATRQFLAGLLAEERDGRQALQAIGPELSWARRVDATRLPTIFKEDGEPERRTIPPAAVHHVLIRTKDVLTVPGVGEVAATLEGFSQVVVSDGTTGEWGNDVLYVNYTEHRLFGHHPLAGEIMVELNPRVLSGGNIFAKTVAGKPGMACRVNIAAVFHIEALGTPLFNKTPVQIASDTLDGVAPVREGGSAHVFSLPLYRVDDPDGELVGFIEAIEYQVLDYAPRDVVAGYRAASSTRDMPLAIS